MPNCPEIHGADTFPPSVGDCVNAGVFDAIISVINSAVDRVNDVLSIEGTTPITHLPTMAGSGYDCSDIDAWGSLWDKLDEIVGTGRAYKQMFYPDGSEWGPPEDQDDIDSYERCDGFWGSISEVENCLTLPGTANPYSWTCEEADNIKSMRMCAECLANLTCYPNCNCPECEEENIDCGCGPCSKCFLIIMEYLDSGGGRYAGYTINTFQNTDVCICGTPVPISPGIVVDSVGVSAWSLSATVLMTGMGLFVSMGASGDGAQIISAARTIKYNPSAGNPGCDALEIPPVGSDPLCYTSLKLEDILASEISPLEKSRGHFKIYFYMNRMNCEEPYHFAFGKTLRTSIENPTVPGDYLLLHGGDGSFWSASPDPSIWGISNVELVFDMFVYDYKLTITYTTQPIAEYYLGGAKCFGPHGAYGPIAVEYPT